MLSLRPLSGELIQVDTRSSVWGHRQAKYQLPNPDLILTTASLPPGHSYFTHGEMEVKRIEPKAAQLTDFTGI